MDHKQEGVLPVGIRKAVSAEVFIFLAFFFISANDTISQKKIVIYYPFRLVYHGQLLTVAIGFES
jgi:hypothetical protein